MPMDLILLTEVQNLLPYRNGKPVSIDTIDCWVRQRVRSATSGMVKRQVQRLGGRTYTSQAWLENFIRGCTTPIEMDFPGQHCAMSDVKRRLIARGINGPAANEQ